MSELIEKTKLEAFASYGCAFCLTLADKHDLFDLFRTMTTKMLMDKPTDIFQYMMDFLKSTERKLFLYFTVTSVIIFGPPASGVAYLVSF
jgi:hypothetical protein